MILKASQRAGAMELALHLLNGDDNDHVTVHDIRGFVADTLEGAFREAEAISRGTRCEKFLFSLSLNPPEDGDVSIDDFETAIADVERKLRLTEQPRVVVFHEKNGRRHCHVVWSRLMFSEHTKRMIAINMAHFKRKLMDVSRDLYLRHGWKMPKGMMRGQSRSPFHLTREEHRQAMRLTQDPQAMKALFKGAWEQSDSLKTFGAALQERGFLLARGDRRGFVALDVMGGVYSLTRWIDVGTRDLKARLGKPEELPSLEQAKAFLSGRMTENLRRYLAEARHRAKDKRKPLVRDIRAIVAVQRKEREALITQQETRWVQETRLRASRFTTGMAGLWQRVTGEHDRIRERNETEAKAGFERDREELHTLIRSHLKERQELQKTVLFYKEEQKTEAMRLRQEMAQYVTTATEPAPALPDKPDNATILASKIEELETRMAALTGDLSQLQASLEDNRLSDEMRARIRRSIEKTMEFLHLKAIAAKTEEARAHDKAREYQLRQQEFNDCLRRYAVLQQQAERERLRQQAEYGFARSIHNMSYSLNGLPAWKITVMAPPPDKRLDEPKLIKSLRKYNMAGLENIVLNTPANASNPKDRPPLDPPLAVAEHRQNVLVVKEMLIRAGQLPRGDGRKRQITPVSALPASTFIKMNPATPNRR
jgi:hypothetical protein